MTRAETAYSRCARAGAPRGRQTRATSPLQAAAFAAARADATGSVACSRAPCASSATRTSGVAHRSRRRRRSGRRARRLRLLGLRLARLQARAVRRTRPASPDVAGAHDVRDERRGRDCASASRSTPSQPADVIFFGDNGPEVEAGPGRPHGSLSRQRLVDSLVEPRRRRLCRSRVGMRIASPGLAGRSPRPGLQNSESPGQGIRIAHPGDASSAGPGRILASRPSYPGAAVITLRHRRPAADSSGKATPPAQHLALASFAVAAVAGLTAFAYATGRLRRSCWRPSSWRPRSRCAIYGLFASELARDQASGVDRPADRARQRRRFLERLERDLERADTDGVAARPLPASTSTISSASTTASAIRPGTACSSRWQPACGGRRGVPARRRRVRAPPPRRDEAAGDRDRRVGPAPDRRRRVPTRRRRHGLGGHRHVSGRTGPSEDGARARRRPARSTAPSATGRTA